MRFAIPLLIIAATVSTHLPAEEFAEQRARNWHQWRGPEGTGTAPLADPPTEWDASTNVRWKAPVPGQGSSTPIIWEDRVYVMTAVKTDRVRETSPARTEPEQAAQAQAAPEAAAGADGGRGRGRFGGGPAPMNYYQFMVLAYDRETGDEVWRTVVAEEVPHEAGHSTNTFASSSPTTDGRRIYADFGSRGIFCLDIQGKVLWERDLGTMQTKAAFGEASSPALHSGVLVIPWDHEGESFIAALDAKTGEEKWRVARDEGTTWATPLITEYEGRTQVIMNGQNRVRSYDLNGGELIWECGGQASNPIPSPVRFQDTAIVMTGFRGYAIYCIPLSAKGDVTDTDAVVWQTEAAAPYVPSPLLYEGQLYFTKANNGVLVSREASTGEVVIDETRLPDISSVYASPVAANGRIYLTSRDGVTLVLRHGDEFELLATNKLDEPIDASPAIAGNEIFLRSSQHLYCISAAPKETN